MTTARLASAKPRRSPNRERHMARVTMWAVAVSGLVFFVPHALS